VISRSSAPPSVKRMGRKVSTVVGRGTAGLRMMPEFLLVGAQRAGTTAIHRALQGHPAIVIPLFHKGVNYFDLSYYRGADWYRGHFPVRAIAERRTAGVPGGPCTFESSGYYMFHPCAPQRIKADLPAVKLLVSLRDPIERAWSHYRRELTGGFETEESFECALDREPERLAGETEKIVADPRYESFSHRHHSYLAKSQYVDQVRTLFDLFGRDRVLVIDSEMFADEPQRTYDQILDFLGLPPFRPAAFGRWNAREKTQPLAEATRRRLDAHFEPYDSALEELLDRPLAWRADH
jgi:Sulfotransferase domain